MAYSPSEDSRRRVLSEWLDNVSDIDYPPWLAEREATFPPEPFLGEHATALPPLVLEACVVLLC